MNNKSTIKRQLTSLILLLSCCFAFSNQSFAAKFNEGDHYVTVTGITTKEKEVREFFSFYCPACFKQESFMGDVAGMLPAGVSFKKNHVDGMPGRDIEIEQALTKALITAEKLGVKEKIVPAIFNYIHIKKAAFTDANDIKNLFVAHGVESKTYDKTFASFATNTQLRKMQNKTKALRTQGFGAVPTLIINGKYKPVLTNLKSMEEYKQLIQFLLNKAN